MLLNLKNNAKLREHIEYLANDLPVDTVKIKIAYLPKVPTLIQRKSENLKKKKIYYSN